MKTRKTHAAGEPVTHNAGLRPVCPPRRAAFSLVEILVTVGLLSFIILGLLAMFHQTQRAFRSSITQTDVLEGGRALTEMFAREMEQIAPCYLPTVTNRNGVIYATNFFAEPSYGFYEPLIQDLPGVNERRSNLVQRIFFLTEKNRDWTGIGYIVIPETDDSGVGTLYRFQSSAANSRNPAILSSEFNYWANQALQRAQADLPMTNLPLYRVADGVVHLRARAVAPNGFPLTRSNAWTGYFRTQPGRQYLDFVTSKNVAVYADQHDPVQRASYFVSNAVPAFVEFELGLLEPQVLRRFRGLGTPTAQNNYLAERSAYVHLFRQQVAVRNVDFGAY